MTFGQRLKAWREQAGMSQLALQDAMGKNGAFVSKLEGGHVMPPDRATCDRAGKALAVRIPGFAMRDVWSAAAFERLAARAPDVAAWLRDEFDPRDALEAAQHEAAAKDARLAVLEAENRELRATLERVREAITPREVR